MMRLPALLLSVFLIPLVSAQNSSTSNASGSATSAQSAAQITVITSFSTTQGLASGRVPFTSVATLVTTSTIQPTQAPPSSSGDPSNASSAASSSTTSVSLPVGTAPPVTDVAPSPGATGGAFGPDDGFVNAGHSLKQNALVLGGLTAVVGLLAL